MTTTALSILLFADVEKNSSYLRHYFGSLREWNQDGLDDTQVVLVSQHQDSSELRAICAEQPFPVEFIEAGHEFVAGYPVWDVLDEVRKAWPLLTGRYVTMQHTEFLWMPGRLRKTIEWLKQNRFYLALGNLRRTVKEGGEPRGSKEVSDTLTSLLESGQWDRARNVSEYLSTSHWVWWQPERKAGPSPWSEDVFFADREWLNTWKMPYHGGKQPFQDIYDLMGRAVEWLSRFKFMPEIERMPQSVNKSIHLWHAREWGAWTPSMSRHFLKDQKSWGLTALGNARVWRDLIMMRTQPTGKVNYKPVIQLRIGPGGTVNRYGNGLKAWLSNGGIPAMTKFYAQHGQKRRER